MKNIIQAIEDDREDFLDEFRQLKGTLKIKAPFSLKSQSTKNLKADKIVSFRKLKAPQLLRGVQKEEPY